MLLVLSVCGSALAQINSWTNPASAPWESTNWSLGVLPNSTQSVMITNAGYKAVGISPVTRATFSNSMTVSKLTVSAPTNAFNTLLLNFFGTGTPLEVSNDCTIGTNGVVENLYSAFEVGGGLFVNGGRYFEQGGLMIATNRGVFVEGGGALNITNAIFEGSIELAGGTVTQVDGQTSGEIIMGIGSYNFLSGTVTGECFFDGGGAFNQYAGTNMGTIMFGNGSGFSDGSGQYTIYNGLAVESDIHVGNGEYGHGNFSQYGGTVITALLTLGSAGDGVGTATGSYFLTNGVLQAAEIGIINGGITQAGGLLFTSNSLFVSGVPPVQYGPAYYTSYSLSGGQLSSPGVGAGPFGSFSQSGGSNGIKGDVGISGSSYNLSGGVLVSSNIEISLGTQWDFFGYGPYKGEFQQTGGTNAIAGNLLVSGGEYALSGGVLLDSSAASYPTVLVATGVSGNQTNTFSGAFVQTGGQHRVANTLSNLDHYQLWGGSLYASNIVLTGVLSVSNSAVILNPGLFQFAGTFQLYDGSVENLGRMSLSSNSVIELMPGSHKLSFSNSAAMSWNQTSSLLVTNWNGSTNGGGSDQLIFGNNSSGLTAPQLRQIVFGNPSGFPAGNYAARILATGEIVPLPNPVLSWQSIQGQLVINWAGQATLQSSTNVLGPYADVPNASSPFTNSSSQGPYRFFRLRR
jgi:hypothetical protein